MFNKAFWKDAAERSIKTAAQAAIVVLTGNAADIWHLDYKSLVSAVVLGAVVSLLTSLVSAKVTGTSDGSLIK